MHTVLLGLNVSSADINVREKIYFAESDLPEALHMLNEYPGISGSVILSTCNRVEIYCAAEDVQQGFSSISEFISAFHKIDKDVFLPFTYQKNCASAVSHLFKVVTSLDSLVVGEYQIQGQVRNAYQVSVDNNCSHTLINKLFQTAIQIGKKSRAETSIGDGHVSVGSVGADLVDALFHKAENLNVAIIGAGEIASLTAESLKKKKKCSITVINRSKTRAKELAEGFDGLIGDFENRYQDILRFDVVIVSTSSHDYIIDYKELKNVGFAKKPNKTFFIDLSLPRNVDPDLALFPNAIVYSIDDLKEQINKNVDKRLDCKKEVNDIIKIVSTDYYDWYAKQTIIPVMKEIKHDFDEMGMRIVRAHKIELNKFTYDQQEIVRKMMMEYGDKIIRVIMRNLKEVADISDLKKVADTLQKTFSIHEVENLHQEQEKMSCPNGHGHSHANGHPDPNGHPHGYPNGHKVHPHPDGNNPIPYYHPHACPVHPIKDPVAMNR